MTVLEFKTGRRRPEHQVQLELYRDAASRLFPGMTIEAQLVYPGAPTACRLRFLRARQSDFCNRSETPENVP